MRTLAIRPTIVSCALVGLLTLMRADLAAQTPPITTQTGADIIFVIDQSGSMSGCTVHPKSNDPHGLRVDAFNELLGRLHGGAYRSLITGNPESFRVSVIEFGDSARIGLDWFLIEADSLMSEADHSDDLEKRIKGILSSETNLGNTHHIDALETCRSQFDKILWGRDGTQNRTLALLFLTDGQSYSSLPQYFTNGTFSTARYLRDLRSELSDITDTLTAGRSIPLDFVVVGLADSAQGSNKWEQSADTWRRYSDEVHTVFDPSEFPATLDSLAARLISSPASNVRDSMEVPCYTAKVRLRVRYSTTMPQFVLKDPDGNRVSLDAIRVEESSHREVFDIVRPMAGVWKLEGNKNSYQVLSELYYQKVTPLVPSLQNPEVPNRPVTFRWQVRSLDDSLFQPHPGCNIHAFTQVEDTAGNVDKVDMRYVAADPGVFEGVADWQPPGSGEYQVQLFGLTPMSTGPDTVIFKSAVVPMIISDKQPLAGEVVSPSNVKRSMGRAKAPLTIRLKSLDSGRPAPPLDSVTTDADNLIFYEVLSSDGLTRQPRTALRGVSASQPGEFTGDIDFDYEETPSDWFGITMLERDSVIVRFDVDRGRLNPQFGIYGFGDDPFDGYEHSVVCRRSLLSGGTIALVLLYLLANVMMLVFDFAWWGLMLAWDFVCGLKRLRLYYQKDYTDSKLFRTIGGMHRYNFGEVRWSVVDKVFALRSLILRFIIRTKNLPFPQLQATTTGPELEGLTLWRRPFSQTANVRLFPKPAVIAPADETRSADTVKREKKRASEKEKRSRANVYQLDDQRATKLPGDLGRLGLDKR
ncbi:MAG: VWA domain-containing protein [candidate division Zixibacteria bacterium]|nr:VWA domain-containing protein [candidate division Zixibacteria bacterium]MDH3936503.1 VWA domain-containing protein [candidate division Zixibacteria bacterium]MDH4032625.1 VWA domain-containing protein [candidate division Zixibacteria bacterium]